MDPRQINYPYYSVHAPQKMYINPHFQQPSKSLQPVYYVNPHFVPQNVTKENPKIHFNPKFINPSQNMIQPLVQKETQYAYNERNLITLTESNETEMGHQKNPVESTEPISKSRYSIVRNNSALNSNIPKVVPAKTTVQKSTVPINKYKSVHINSVKEVLGQTAPATSSKPIVNANAQRNPLTSNKNKYKLVKTTPIKKLKNKFIRDPSKLRLSTSKCKYIKPAPDSSLYKYNNKKLLVKTNLSKKAKTFKSSVNKDKLKINNIPCPLYKKYGYCIRKTKAKCEFLHDKKLVSICRKFLKGSCHDTNCLLSHELSTKKMPTCDFFLKGMCTKSKCPYLHVKLSDNATVCRNFLKGYCENGEKCMNRHVNTCPEEIEKGICSKKRCPYSHNKNRTLKLNKVKGKVTKTSEKAKETVKDSKVEECETADPKSRYYLKQTSDKKEDIDVIKPSRCKLGSLPSFIKL